MLLLSHERDSKVWYGSLYEILSWKLELWQDHGYYEKQQYILLIWKSIHLTIN